MRHSLLLALSIGAFSQAAAQGFQVEVVDQNTGLGIPLATVTLLAETHQVLQSALVADSLGRVFVAVPEPANYRLTVRRLGYASTTTEPRNADPKRLVRIRIELAPTDQVLLPVEIVGEKGFEARQVELRKNMGRGKVWSKGLIDSMAYRDVADVINSRGMGHLERGNDGWQYTPALQSGCRGVNVYLNNQLVSSRQGDKFSEASALAVVLDLELRSVYAVEYYPTRASTPPELTGGNSYVCGAIVVWTRPFR